MVFDNDEENKFEYTTIHTVSIQINLKAFKNTVDDLLNGVMSELGVNEDIIMLAFRNETNNPNH